MPVEAAGKNILPISPMKKDWNFRKNSCQTKNTRIKTGISCFSIKKI